MKIPKITKVQQQKHSGEAVWIVSWKIIFFWKDSLEILEKAKEKWIKNKDLMITYIMWKKYYAL